jgi:PiT family inorganic phosphate transporter
MDIITTIALLLAGFYVGWNIGANDAANCIGTTVGARIISYRKAVILMAICVILGGTLQGQHVMKTVGKGIVLSDAQAWEAHNERSTSTEFKQFFPDDRLPDRAILTALLCAGLFVTLSTLSSLPVSTSQAVVGGVAGVGFGIVGFQASYFQGLVLLKIVAAWIISPLLTMLLAFALHKLLQRLLRRMHPLHYSRYLGWLVLVSAAYTSYSLGANDLGNAIGPLLSKYPDDGHILALMGGIAMAVGAWTLGARVTETVGSNITDLDYSSALSAQFAAAFGVHLFTIAGLPVSTSQAVIGGVIGVGLTRGAQAISSASIYRIFAGWVVTPVCAAVLAALVYRGSTLLLEFTAASMPG